MASWGSEQILSTILLLAVLIGACSEKEKTPADVLSKQQMTRVLIQVHLLEAKVGRLGLTHDSAKQVYNHLHYLMLEKEGIDSAAFTKSFDYYSLNHAQFTKIYNAVVDSLIEQETREKLLEDERAKEDSIKSKLAQDSIKQDSVKEKPKPVVKRKFEKPRPTPQFKAKKLPNQ